MNPKDNVKSINAKDAKGTRSYAKETNIRD